MQVTHEELRLQQFRASEGFYLIKQEINCMMNRFMRLSVCRLGKGGLKL
jgi:hypothetical protein